MSRATHACSHFLPVKWKRDIRIKDTHSHDVGAQSSHHWQISTMILHWFYASFLTEIQSLGFQSTQKLRWIQYRTTGLPPQVHLRIGLPDNETESETWLHFLIRCWKQQELLLTGQSVGIGCTWTTEKQISLFSLEAHWVALTFSLTYHAELL